jgi:hypothetical protein
VNAADTLPDKGGGGGHNNEDNYGGQRGGCIIHFQGRGWVEFDLCGARGQDNYRSDNETALVVDSADTLSNKGRRGGDNNNDNDG